MRVKIKPLGILRDLAEGAILEVELKEGATVGDLIEELDRRYRGFKEAVMKPYVTIAVNGREIEFAKGFETELSDGSIVAFLPPYAGG
jgi:molybdopterin synthase sulfur carrier subunit